MTAPTQPAAPAPGTPEYDAAMVAKFEAAQPQANQPAPAPAAATRPEHIPEKFWDAEKGEVRVAELAKSYAELEKARAKPADEGKPAEGKPAEQKPADAAAPLTAEQFEAYGREVAEKGDLTPESRAKLVALGIPEAVIDAHVQGVQALSTNFEARVHSTVGGPKAYEAMTAWAASNLTPSEIDAFDRAITAGSPDQALLAVQGLNARYRAAVGSEPAGQLGGSGSVAAAGGYASQAEMVRDMKHPHYATDPAFRARVEAKLAATTAF